ncbi:MAG: TRAP transporter substrate-binding protein DctP [Gammaproteobacteria bacterium]|jgi:TRAP-type C4-dicarboxylate transport system substrate-binding protein
MMITKLLRHCTVLLLLATMPAGAASRPEYVLKFATLAPSGTTWMNLLEKWGETVESRSDGRLVFKFYPGGVQGDEPDVLKKMHFNQLQGGAFTGYGIGRMYSPARVLELPFLFRDYGEVDYVRTHFTEQFEQGFRDNGYELLGWIEVGFVHMFSTDPVNTMEGMKSRRVWLWQGDPLGEAFFTVSGISPVPLSIVDVYTSLSTGLVDTVPCTPLAAIALQWFTKTPYVSSVSLTNGMGGLIVSKRFFDRLPADLQKLLRETGGVVGQRIVQATREDNETSLQELERRGLEFVDPGEGMSPPELMDLRDRAAAVLIESDYIPAPVFEKTRALLDEYRSRQSASSADP